MQLENQKANILVVDDNAGKRLALVSVLESLNQNVITADSGRDALRALLEHEFAVILLDVQMPIMNGFETARLIRSRPQSESTPIIFVTAFSRGETDMVEVIRSARWILFLRRLSPKCCAPRYLCLSTCTTKFRRSNATRNTWKFWLRSVRLR